MVNATKLRRTWRRIAAEVAQETNPEKLGALTEELLRAMEEEKRQADRRLLLAQEPPARLKKLRRAPAR